MTKKIEKIKKSLSYKGKQIEYFLKYKNQKHINLKILNDQIIISAPFFAEDWEIEFLIYKNISKIQKILDYHEKNKLYLISEKGFIKINNKKIDAIFSKNDHKNEFFFKKYETNEETIKKMYSKLSIIYKNYFEKLVNKHKNIMQLDYKNLTVKQLKNKWGVCYPEKSKIVLNISLIHFPERAIEYVIIHELSHLIHKNHSKDFWRCVEKYMPDYKNVSELLKVNI